MDITHKPPHSLPWYIVFTIFFLLLVLAYAAFLTQKAFAPASEMTRIEVPPQIEAKRNPENRLEPTFKPEITDEYFNTLDKQFTQEEKQNTTIELED